MGKIDLYRYDNGTWVIHRTNCTLSSADHNIKHSSSRLVAVSHGIVIAASEVDDLELAFDDIDTVDIGG